MTAKEKIQNNNPMVSVTINNALRNVQNMYAGSSNPQADSYYNPHRQYPSSTMARLIRRFSPTTYYSSPGEYIGPQHRPSPFPRYIPSNMSTAQSPDQEPVKALPPPNGKCIITTLPTEMIQEISKHLIVESLVCFSLTSKTILNAIGNQSWTNPCITGRWNHDHPGNIIHRVSFLCFLARDLEGWAYCSACAVLHPKMPRPRDLRAGRKLKDCFGARGIVDYFPKTALGEEGGYTLTFEHVKEALGPIMDTYPQEEIEMMSGSYSVLRKRLFSPTIKHALNISSKRIGKQLVFKHEHRFSVASGPGKRGVWPQDILSFPLRICPHHTTSSNVCKDMNSYAGYWDHHKNTWLHRTWYNGPMLTHVVNSAFPAHKRITSSCRNWFWFLRPKFRDPAITEENQMKAERTKEDLWWCRSCPTKFKVEFEKEDQEVAVTVWQCLGRNEDTAKTNWWALVRRERNTEFAAESREFPLFRCD